MPSIPEPSDQDTTSQNIPDTSASGASQNSTIYPVYDPLPQCSVQCLAVFLLIVLVSSNVLILIIQPPVLIAVLVWVCTMSILRVLAHTCREEYRSVSTNLKIAFLFTLAPVMLLTFFYIYVKNK